jgi:hypothetical protein
VSPNVGNLDMTGACKGDAGDVQLCMIELVDIYDIWSDELIV